MPSKKTSKRLRLSLPATSANLGPAFDAAALAMDFYINIDATEASEFSIAATGRDSAICSNLEEHLILNTYREVLQAAGRNIVPLSLRIQNDIPIGKGCGSSAAARLAGIALAVHFGRLHWTDAEIVGEASRREHHPDNASACWMGGLTVARMSGEAEAQMASIRPKGKDGILGAVLSGAGPSVLIFVNPRASLLKVQKLVAAHLSRNRLTAELIPTSITARGARSSFTK